MPKTKSVLVNKRGKVDAHITDSQSQNGCCRVSDHEFTFVSAVQLAKKKNNVL